MDGLKGPALYATGGGLLAAIALVICNANQIQIADHWATVIGGVAAGVAAAAAAFAAAVKKKSGN